MTAPIAGGTLYCIARRLKNLHELTSPAYNSISTVLIFGFINLTISDSSTSDNLSINLDGVLLILFGAFFSLIFMTLLFKSMQYEEASKLSIFTYLSVLFMFIFDTTIVGTKFNLA